ncbi:MAG: dicarboxylate/amino acid:cation symporter [Cytophagales bacterium]|nr:dicarboxylate/amino acid:cation symporter [Bernardetiaceae bacterium]MDW8210150.1 dicarboxylate/amino acid:cation symporter [Cytophagales bacterium]
MKRKKLPLYAQILIGLFLGLLWGLISAWLQLPKSFTGEFIKPLGVIFVTLLKMVAAPLVLASLIVGVASLHDIRKLSRIGGKTIAIYISTTVVAIALGLTIANLVKPGERLPASTRQQLMTMYADKTSGNNKAVEQLKERPILQPLIDVFPDNVTAAAADNTRMLQVVFFAVIMGVSLIKIAPEKRSTLVHFFDALNDAIIQIVDFIMILAPAGVFALIGSLIVEIAGEDISQAVHLLSGLGWYAGCVLVGLFIHTYAFYPLLFRWVAKIKYLQFFRAIRAAQLVGFSTSSSNATLPVTMKRCREGLGIPEEITSFVLPLGATINMDGTSLYQAVAAVFIAQALGIELSISDQLMILLTATLASIGSAGVPGSGMVMLIIVLEAIQVPSEGIALIVAVDRILDMARTVVNVTGDITVATLITATEAQFEPVNPVEKE